MSRRYGETIDPLTALGAPASALAVAKGANDRCNWLAALRKAMVSGMSLNYSVC